ncbi:MAG: caspase family protein, partial [Elainellaceae cyanobacterium]
MTQYWAIAVGINQYSQLQQPPLMYAERDAAALYDYWLDDAQFEPDHCRLIIGTPPSRASDDGDDSVDDSIAPTRAAIYKAVEDVAQQVSADDIFWLTFSGYALQADGEDYLLVADSGIDSDLGTPANAIALSDLMALLDKTTAQPVLLLDLKRLGYESDAELGRATLALAEQYGIPTILGCQPEQLSHETLTLRQGLFTTALLESLRQNGVALDHLGQDLRDRLPRLSERHWRPIQTPMVFIPDAARYQLLAPGKPAQIPPPEFDDGFDEGFDAIPTADDTPTIEQNLELDDPLEDDAESVSDSSGINLPNVPSATSPRLATPSLPSVPTLPAPTPQITPRVV